MLIKSFSGKKHVKMEIYTPNNVGILYVLELQNKCNLELEKDSV